MHAASDRLAGEPFRTGGVGVRLVTLGGADLARWTRLVTSLEP